MENLKQQWVTLVFIIPGVVLGGLIGALVMGGLGFVAQKVYDKPDLDVPIKAVVILAMFFIGVGLWFGATFLFLAGVNSL